jgi:hypothetical protein
VEDAMDDTAFLTRFFSAWGMTDADERKAVVGEYISPNCLYADPHCPAPLTGPDAVAEMLAGFTQNMPGGAAKVVGEANGHNGFFRVAVAFEKDGSEMVRGQYFGQRGPDGLLHQIVGFVGGG